MVVKMIYLTFITLLEMKRYEAKLYQMIRKIVKKQKQKFKLNRISC